MLAPQSQLGRAQAEMLIFCHNFFQANERFPNSGDFYKLNQKADRGTFTGTMRRLEEAGYLRRLAHGYDSAYFTPFGLRAVQRAHAMGVQLPLFGPAQHDGRGPAWVLPKRHAALRDGRTLHPKTVVTIDANPLKSGGNVQKIGERVEKGAWRGMPIFVLALEERATCPRSCAVWDSCFGNHMHRVKRQTHGPALMAALANQLGRMQQWATGGFVVRLHELGDFVDREYAEQWLGWLSEFWGLHIFGYTAHAPESDVGGIVRRMNAHKRCKIRWSNQDVPFGTRILKAPPIERIPDAVVCPEQTGKTRNCGSCALCWSTEKAIAFLWH